MSESKPVKAALRSGAMALGAATAIVLAIFAYIGLLEFNAWLIRPMTETGRGYAAAALFIALIGVEVGVSVAIFVAVKAYRKASHG